MMDVPENTIVDLERTDELPVLSEESIAAIQKAVLNDTGQSDLAWSVERLRRMLESAEQRWSELETRLEAQTDAIAGLNSAIGALGPAGTRSGYHGSEVSAEAGWNDDSEAQHGQATGEQTGTATAAATDASPETDPVSALLGQDGRADNPFVERIAALERFIAERNEAWDAMEQELKTRNLRIVELEAEIEQRIERELNLERRIEQESARTDELRERIDELSRQLEDARFVTAETALEPTRQSSRPSVLDLIEEDRGVDAAEPAPTGLEELVCLTSDEPRRYLLDQASVTIGRSPDCDIHIPTHFVSRKHATIRRENTDLIIEDQASTNGVFVNAVRVKRKRLEHGDWVTIGETQFRFLGVGSHE